MIIAAFSIITLVYVILIACFAVRFDKVTYFTNEHYDETIQFTIVIPFRNEAESLPLLLKSLVALDYSHHLFEIILVNDHSQDNSENIVSEFLSTIPSSLKIRLLQNTTISKSPKKDAISLAISKANFDWIITTDADCIVPKNWLHKFNTFIPKQETKMIVAPVMLNTSQNFLSSFQQLDMLSLQGVTIGAFGMQKPFLSNGANLCYSKELFNTLNGYEGNNHLASGDDIFLLEKAIAFDHTKVHYLKHKDSIVLTSPEDNWNALIAQRVRWASKAKAYKNNFSKLTSFIVLLMNATLVIATALAISGVINHKPMLYLWFIKLNIDLWLIYKSAEFFSKKNVLRFYWISVFIYPFFTTYIALKSQIGTYSWKNRTFTK
ncbi:glycosyltransferase [Ichthyenterobacterium sp. W332]|uniref:Glycosyltransferase n=1 Tax=Microcosmobacter mediterraneus TaxID=3075607 RepID=A0ABU2YLC9_9FLAO|nr:glycosyltransferase [Ichthyenterobacterium sp. W332]MDT0558963.1 glycosyltransferase [Ichthyenterobacterium sp. W332]